MQPKEFIKDLVQGNYNVRENPYFFVADIGHTFGSKEGEGSPVNIKFEKGGQLKKSNQLRTFTNGWVDKYL